MSADALPLPGPWSEAGNPAWNDCAYVLACGPAAREPNESHLMRAAAADNRLYVGSTNNLRARLREHREGDAKFTAVFEPLALVGVWRAPDRPAATAYETRLKERLWDRYATSEVFVYSA